MIRRTSWPLLSTFSLVVGASLACSGGVDECPEEACVCGELRATWVGTCALGESDGEVLDLELRIGGYVDALEGVGVLTTSQESRVPGDLVFSCESAGDATLDTGWGSDEPVQRIAWTSGSEADAVEVVLTIATMSEGDIYDASCAVVSESQVASGVLDLSAVSN